MTAKVIRGQGVAHTPGTEGGAGDLPSARFQVLGNAQSWSTNTDQYILWDVLSGIPNRATWDDLGFPIDYNTDGGFFFGPGYAPIGEYDIEVHVRLDPASAGDAGFGTWLIALATGDAVDEEESTLASMEIGPKLHVSGRHRFYAGDFFQVSVASFNCSGGPFTITAASITIAKARTIFPLGT